MIDMLPVNVQKEMLLNHTRYLRFFRLRRERVKPGQNHPAQRMAESLPAVYKQTLDLAFYQSLMMLLDPEKDVVSGLINREELEEKFHRLDRAVDLDPGFQALGHMEREAAKLNGSELSAAALEGLGLGSIGIGSPEGTIKIKGKARGAAGAVSFIINDLHQRGFQGRELIISHCHNAAFVGALREKITELWPGVDITVLKTRGLDSFYAERGGIIISYL